jgi:heme/copper-type cytochrome/quinol oxidase subunit 3
MDAIAITSKPNISKAVPDGVLAMIFLLFTEGMLFAGLISAYIVNRAGARIWPPADQPRLPIEVTGINTLILLLSGVIVYLFYKRVKRVACIDTKSTNLLLLTIMLGAAFLAVQAFFYTLIGVHGFHVLVGLCILFYLYFAVKKATSFEAAKNKIAACILYWYFVVAIWPILYRLVYFN